MGNNDIIVAENYDFLKGNRVKVKVLQEIMTEKKPMVVDNSDEYKNICQKFNIERIKGIIN